MMAETIDLAPWHLAELSKSINSPKTYPHASLLWVIITERYQYDHIISQYELLAYNLAHRSCGDQKFALSISGADGPIRRPRWEQLAASARIPPKAVNLILDTQIHALQPMAGLIHASFLPTSAQAKYERILRERTRILAPGPADSDANT